MTLYLDISALAKLLMEGKESAELGVQLPSSS